MKQLWDDPWPTIFSELPPGKVVKCKVVSVVDYGAFVRVRDGVEGLISSNVLVEIKEGDASRAVRASPRSRATAPARHDASTA